LAFVDEPKLRVPFDKNARLFADSLQEKQKQRLGTGILLKKNFLRSRQNSLLIFAYLIEGGFSLRATKKKRKKERL
jgi:hypothetical protein